MRNPIPVDTKCMVHIQMVEKDKKKILKFFTYNKRMNLKLPFRQQY